MLSAPKSKKYGSKQFYVAFLEDIMHHPLNVKKGVFQCIALFWGGVGSVAVL